MLFISNIFMKLLNCAKSNMDKKIITAVEMEAEENAYAFIFDHYFFF